MRSLRVTAWLLVAALIGSACAADSTPAAGPGGTDPADLVEIDQVASTVREDVPSALDSPEGDGLPDPIVDVGRIRSGGPPPDGIPSIDRPLFHRTADVDFLRDEEPVVAVEVGGDARAYPVQIMMWHEIVNDTIGGEPVTVTYCPLCNSAIAYDRRLGDRILDFGTSGSLFNSAMVMYDRQTESLWSHFSAEGIAGVLTGEELDRIPMAMVGWGEWRDANPDGLVLSRETGHSRDYGRNPYSGYDDIANSPFLFDGEDDGRLQAMTRVVGIEGDDDAVAVQLDDLLDEGTIDAQIDGRPVVVWAVPGTASALDTSDIADGRDVGTTGVFSPIVDGRTLGFDRDGDLFTDDETGSTWDVFGVAVAGPLEGEQLDRVVHVDTFWFAWAAFLPDTVVVP